jgi:hypothetical protein
VAPFDYLSVLISIVLGLAIANVLGRLAAVVTARARYNFYWPPLAWAIWIFFIAVQHWWAQWGVRHTASWSFGAYWLQLLVPVDLFLLSSLVLPERQDEVVDLGDWYFDNRRWFFAVMFFLPALSIADEFARSGHMSSTLNLIFLLAFDAVILLALALPSRKAQEWITAQAMVLTIAYVGLLFVALPS